jgi:iron complex outermembrane receptor protein
MKKYQFLGGAAFVAAASLSIPAYAQSSEPAENEGGIAEIIVTARKTSESLQTTPVAVSALSGEALAEQAIVNIQQIQASSPNLTFSSAVAQPGSSTVFIRGQGSTDGLIAIDQAVLLLVDKKIYVI